MATTAMSRGWMVTCAGIILGCTAAPQGGEPNAIQAVSIADVAAVAAAGSIQGDFEDGTTQGWFPFGSPTVANSTDVAFSGTHSLLTTNRTATFMGPGTNITSQVVPGATYKVSVQGRLVSGQAATTLAVTVMSTLTDGSQRFTSVVNGVSVTDQAWSALTGSYTVPSSGVSSLILYVESASASASYYIDAFSMTQTTPAPLAYDFEDGTTQPWFPFGSPTLANSTDVAVSGTHSLKVTNRTASFMGPGLNVQGLLTKGATYQVTLSVRMVAGQPSSTLQATVQRTPTGGSAQFDSVGSAANVTDQTWSTISGIYSFGTDNSGLIFYVQTSSGTASFYIDNVTIAQVAPPAGPPGNTAGASATFESNTNEGWKSRTGNEIVAPSQADAHSGTHSLLTSNRTATFQGSAFDVTSVMFNGSRYFVSLWAKLAPGSPDTQLRVSLDRKLGTTETFNQVVGNTTVTANAWVRLQATYDMALANSSVTLYVESASGTPSFYIDDFQISYVVPPVAETNIPAVDQAWASYFPIGAAVIPADISGQPAVLLAKHFNSITSGNDMKWDATEPSENNFTYAQADAEVAFAKAHGMQVRGHTLVWHNQTPAWVFNDASGNPMTPTPDNQALLTKRLQNHIQNVVTHFGNDVYAWDVINEAIDPSQPDGYRRSPWFNILGPQYIDIALTAARAASPTARLYINDFDTTNPTKRDLLLAVVRGLKSRGVPLDGVGHQMHNNIEYPSPQSVIDAVNLFNGAGVDNAVTELDVSIYSGSFPTPFTSYTDIPQSRHVQVGYSYLGFFQAFKQLQGKIGSVTIWGTSDDKSWLTSSTKVDAPLLFDTSLQHKPAYWAVVDPLQLPGADLSTTLTAAPSPVPAGQGITYTVTVTNNKDQDTQPYQPSDDDLPAASVAMTMAVPAHTGFQSVTVPAGWTCTTPPAGGSGPIKCTIASLAPGASGQFSVAVAQNDCAQANGAAITATAGVTSATADPNPAANNSASVTVQVANPPPVITAAGSLAMTVECHTSYTDPGATAIDACDGVVPVSVASTVNVDAVGAYSVTYGAQDSAGNLATPVVRAVTVSDTTAPVLTVTGGSTLWPPQHEYITVPMSALVSAASDSCDSGVGVASAVITQVSSDEADNGNGDGNTVNDILIAADCRSVQLRAERAGNLNGRFYTVTLRVKDASGNATLKSVKMVVPLDDGSAVEDGEKNTVVSGCR